MAHPSRKTTPELKYFNTDLFPDLKGDLPFEWLIRQFTTVYTADVSRVETLVRKFISDFVRYINKCGDENIPESVKACKRRSAQLIELCQELIGVNEQDYTIVPLTKDAQLLKSNYKVRFTKKFAVIDNNDDGYIMDIDITSNPRCYRSLFDAAIITCYLPSKEDRSLVWVLLQTVGELYKSVKLTDREILELESEFICAAEDCTDTFTESEAERLINQLEKDMKLSNPPLYCADLAKARRAIDGYLYNHEYDIDDASYSTSSSGSQLLINGVNIPNMALIFSAIETDVSLSVDKTLKYKSFYTKSEFPGLTQRNTVSMHVPKTSSRGERWIHLNSNGRQDRGNIIDSCMEYVLKNVIRCDCTYDQHEGLSVMYQKIITDINNELVIAGTDMKAATDWIDHKALIRIWKIFFKEDIPDFLLWLHSGEGTIQIHDPLSMERVEKNYTQIRGIKCGTRSNFAVGLALIHHIVMRITMLKLGLRDGNPEDFYRVLGDDNNHFLKKKDFLPIHSEDIDDWRLWLSTYTSLAHDVGFRVHPIEEKGTLSIAGESSLSKGEFAKQTWSQYGMVSGIPYKLFWASLRDKSHLLPIILWMSQYTILRLDTTKLDSVAKFLCPQNPNIFCDVWDFACNHELYGLHEKMKSNNDYICGYSERQIAVHFFDDFLNNTIMDTIINNRSRLSRSAQMNKISKYCLLVEDTTLIDQKDTKRREQVKDELEKIHQFTGNLPLIDYLIKWSHENNAPMSKLEYCLIKNQKFSDSLRDITDNPFVILSSNLGIFNERDQEIIKKAIPYVRFGNYNIPGENPVEILLQARNLLKEKQPISISKRMNRSSKFMINVINNISLEIPENLSLGTDGWHESE